MVSKREELQHRKRELIKAIISNFIEVYSYNDTRLERVPMIQLQNCKINTEDYLKWLNRDDGYVSGTYICVNKEDATANKEQKN